MSIIIKNSSGGGITLDSSTTANETLALPAGGGTLLKTDGDGSGLTGIVTGKVLQVVSTADGVLATGTTTIPDNNTIPTSTEGVQFLSRTITPTDASNNLLIEVVFNYASSANDTQTVALFKDTDAAAIAASGIRDTSANVMMQLSITHHIVAGSISLQTFSVRSGNNGAGTTSFNGAAGLQIYGGVSASSITITEYTP